MSTLLTEEEGPVRDSVPVPRAGLLKKRDGFLPTDLRIEAGGWNYKLGVVEEPPSDGAGTPADQGLDLVAVAEVGRLPDAQVLPVPAKANSP